MTPVDVIIVVLLIVLAGSAAFIGHRTRSPRLARASVDAFTGDPVVLRRAMLSLFAGVVVIAQADAVRAHAGLPLDHGGLQVAILIGYALLTVGFLALARRVAGARAGARA